MSFNKQSIGYNYAPATEENGPLASCEIGDKVTKTIRTVNCIYYSESFQVYQVAQVNSENRFFTIVGSFPYRLSLNAYYIITGTVTESKRHEKQVKVETCESTFPTDYNGIITVLKTLHGLDTQAYKLYDRIGPNVLELIKTAPEMVAEMVKGIGKKRAKAWQLELLARGENDRELKKLYALGITAQQATRLVATYGIDICSRISFNPYLLIELGGRNYTFKACDKIALGTAGLGIENPDRLEAGIQYVLSEYENRGNCACPYSEFLPAVHALVDFSISYKEAQSILKGSSTQSIINMKWGRRTYAISLDDIRSEMAAWSMERNNKKSPFRYVVDSIDEKDILAALNILRTGDHIVVEEYGGITYVMRSMYYKAEADIAANIRTFLGNEISAFSGVESVLDGVLRENNIVLETKQREAVLRICQSEGGIFILNGSAGCGKTFTLNIIIKVLRKLYEQQGNKCLDPCILAPTGKAAKVASNATKLPAYTIHRALGLISSDVGFENNDEKLNSNCVIVDEFSMVDELLCAQLLQGISKGAKVILLGDTAQLPSVRPGRVLRDMIDSGQIPVITLDVVKRQSAGSGVLVNAEKIVQGENIESCVIDKDSLKGNAYVMAESNPYKALKRVLTMAGKFGLSAFQKGDVQVLSPIKAGVTGVNSLNILLQEKLNPKTDLTSELVYGNEEISLPDGRTESRPAVFRTGDIVIHIKNNYDASWFSKDSYGGYYETPKSGIVNGATGVIETIKAYTDSNKTSHKEIYVKYEDHYIVYADDFSEIMLAYAMTIHKSQGSQWPIVICPITQRTMLLNRKLLYTMYTRAQDTSILIGNPEYITEGIKNNYEDKRCTLLTGKISKS